MPPWARPNVAVGAGATPHLGWLLRQKIPDELDRVVLEPVDGDLRQGVLLESEPLLLDTEADDFVLEPAKSTGAPNGPSKMAGALRVIETFDEAGHDLPFVDVMLGRKFPKTSRVCEDSRGPLKILRLAVVLKVGFSAVFDSPEYGGV